MRSPARKTPQPRSRFSPEYGLLLDRLVEARTAASLRQEDLAERLGKVQSHVSLIESREREISFVEVVRWLEACGMHFSDFAKEYEEELAAVRRTPKRCAKITKKPGG